MKDLRTRIAPILSHYADCFAAHGATPKGVDWPRDEDALRRHQVMVELVQSLPKKSGREWLDVGCGYGAFYAWLEAQGQAANLHYQGVDLIEEMIVAARALHPHASFDIRDLLANPLPEKTVDVAVLNGVLTERRGIPHTAMVEYAKELLSAVFKTVREGMVFNVMSTHVDWQREDLFHWSMDEAVAFLSAHCSRHVVVRADYGLYEYSVYVYTQPHTGGAK